MVIGNVKLTARQAQVVDIIAGSLRRRGYVPSVREIADVMGIRNPHGVVCHLKALEAKGVISREHNRSRAIKLLIPLSPPAKATERKRGIEFLGEAS